MEGHFAVAGEGAKELFQHFSFKVTNEFPGQGNIENKVTAAADVHTGAAQGLIHRGKLESIAINASLVPQRIIKGFSQQNANVFNGMVVVRFVTMSVDGQIKFAMLGEEGQHVIKKPNAGVDLGYSRPINIE